MVVTAGATSTAADEHLRIFVSYRRSTASADARRLHDSLVYRFGIRHVFMDLSGIEAGEDFLDVIAKEVQQADVFVAVMDPLWATVPGETGRARLHDEGDVVRMEVELALQRNMVVIPVLVRGARMPSVHELPPSIALLTQRHWFELSNERWSADIARLIARLERIETTKRRTRRVIADGQPPGRMRTDGTSFIGRDREVAELLRLIESARSVTIVGPGGVGKTRLALEVASAERRYGDAVFVATLADLPEGSLLVPTVARALDVKTAPGEELTLERLIARVADQRFLLVLDNCEHLLEPAAELVGGLTRHCPDVRVLATSRELLRHAGEKAFPLSPFPAPEGVGAMDLEALSAHPAVRLFVDRARDASPSFELDEGSASSVARLVEMLDGLPLAIELAAARVNDFGSVAELLEALSDRFDPVVASRRGGDPRHRTLWAMVDCSYELLGTGERLVFERLSAFGGDFSIASAASVCGADLPAGSVEAGLRRLAAHWLVQRVQHDGRQSRFRLLFTIREYAQKRFAGRADDPTMRELQRWAREVAETHGKAVDVGDEMSALAVLDAEHPNLLGALQAALEATDGAVLGAIASALAPYWELRGSRVEGAAWVDRALGLLSADDDGARGPCLLAASRLAPPSDSAGRRSRAEQALLVADRIDDDVLASAALAIMGHVDAEINQVESARRNLQAALRRAEAAGDLPGIALASERLSFTPGWGGNPNGPQPTLLRAIELYERLGNRRGRLWCLAQMGHDYVAQEEMQKAIDAYTEGLRLAQEMGYPHGEAWMWDALAETSMQAGDPVLAGKRFTKAEALQRGLRNHTDWGWSLGGLVESHRLAGHLDEAMRWLQEFVTFVRDDLAPPGYRRSLLLEAGHLACRRNRWEAVGWVVGALDALARAEDPVVVDSGDYRFMEEQAGAAIDHMALAEAKRWGGATPPADVAQRVVDVLT